MLGFVDLVTVHVYVSVPASFHPTLQTATMHTETELQRDYVTNQYAEAFKKNNPV